jgi:hypothetical protein
MTTAAVEIQHPTGYQLVATDQAQMQAAHGHMIDWARAKQLECDRELSEERANLSIAEDRKWATAAFKRRISMLEKRRVFYEKIEIALNAGYVIVPNFEMDIFAIRTVAYTPRGGVRSGSFNNFDQEAQRLPAGEGEYRNPKPVVLEEREKVKDEKGERTLVTQWPSEFQDVDFPIALAKPVLMSRTAEAMAAKVFDEVGVARDTQWRGSRRGDPIILGRIRNPRPNRPDMTFFVGWFFDPTNV